MIILKKWIGKNVFVQLKSGRFYDGKITDVQFLEANPDICLIFMYDRLGKEVIFYSNEVEVLESKNGDKKENKKEKEDW